KTDANPMEPQSDDEKAAEKKADEKKDDAKDKPEDKKKSEAKDKDKKVADKDKEGGKDKKEEPVTVTIDFDNIGQRIVPLPIKGANYVQLDAGKAGTLYLSGIPDVPSLTAPTLSSVSKFDLTTRKTEPFVAGVSSFAVSANGEKALY